MKKPITFKVGGSDQGLPIQTVLARKLALSRNETKRLLDGRQVFVNNQRVWMARHELVTGDRIEVHGIKENAPEVPVKILWKDKHYLIIDKPPGILSNGGWSIEARLARDLERPVYAVHRLDRDTSGCMLLSWSREGRERMIPVFQRREVNKIYEGLVVGKFPPGIESISRPVDGEEALTLVRVLRKRGPFSRVEFTLITGRTHQVRRHLNVFDLHLAGEKNYGKTVLEQPLLRTITRHMLHARQLGFVHPDTGEGVKVRAALPGDFQDAARALGV